MSKRHLCTTNTCISMSQLQKAKEFAKQVHTGHKRLSGEGYAEHTLRVYQTLKRHNIKEENTLVASLLHHALDYSTELEQEIEKAFGKEVLTLVKNLKKVSATKIETDTPSQFNEKYIMQTYINLSEDVRNIVIRLADKTDNLKHSWALDKEKRNYNAEKAMYLYSPLARIVGMSKLAVELENEAFKILNPAEYYKIQKISEEKALEHEGILKDTLSFLRSILKEQGLNNIKVQGRIKHIYGIYRKANYLKSAERGTKPSYKGVYDTLAFRIIAGTIEDCYFVENLVRELWECYPERRDDYIEKPRPSGYQALHNVFRVNKDLDAEIQITTYEMHKRNEHGPSSHLLYKISERGRSSMATDEFRKYLKENPFWFKDVNFWEMEKTLSKYKPQTPFSKNVYVFTPKGDIIELPQGATPIDFAYEIHSTLGNGCIGAFVNKSIAKLDQVLKNGDLVEIKTLKSKKKPSRDWLKIVKTKKAKASIRKALGR